MRLSTTLLVTVLACAFARAGKAETTIELDTKGRPHNVAVSAASISPAQEGSVDTKGRRHAYAITYSQIQNVSESDVTCDTKGRPHVRQGTTVK